MAARTENVMIIYAARRDSTERRYEKGKGRSKIHYTEAEDMILVKGIIASSLIIDRLLGTHPGCLKTFNDGSLSSSRSGQEFKDYEWFFSGDSCGNGNGSGDDENKD